MNEDQINIVLIHLTTERKPVHSYNDGNLLHSVEIEWFKWLDKRSMVKNHFEVKICLEFRADPTIAEEEE